MSEVTLAAIQMACGEDREENLEKAERMVRKAAEQGGQVILLQEFYQTPYFCKDQLPGNFDLARTLEEDPGIARLSKVAAELEVVLPLSFFERANRAYFNSLVVVDADGSLLDLYRKSHIPDGPGYQEKYYFTPGDTGFKTWDTRYGRIGVAICWDQWFPECARAMALQGADALFYPTAIGSEPQDPSIDSKDHWQRIMQGHAAANMLPLVACNRVGVERGEQFEVTYYGSSFITGIYGEKIVEADREEETILTASFDFEALRHTRAAWGLFRDRRPDLYYPLLSLDGGRR